MKKNIKYFILFFLLSALNLIACKKEMQHESIISPNGKIKLLIQIQNGNIQYSLTSENEIVIKPSKLGFRLKNMDDLGTNMKMIKAYQKSVNETWEQIWGERRLVENRYNELVVEFQEHNKDKRKLMLFFRVFDDGLAFRYHIPKQKNMSDLTILEELTQYNLATVKEAWWISAYKTNFYEGLYQNTPLSQMDTVSTPLTLEMENGKFVAIHEANLTNYAAQNLYFKENGLHVDLTPMSTGEKVFAKAGMYSPWQTVTIAGKAGDLITSYMSLNLNDPNQIKDISWLKTGKYIGIWWSMHKEIHTWGQGEKHGATTENAKKYIDFAAENGFTGVLIEGWNYGWDGDWVANGHLFNFLKPYPDFDIEEITKYAAAKNIQLIGHHETGGATENYERQMEDAFAFYQKLGVSVVKTGYVTSKLDKKELHSSQYGINHYRKVIETAAKYHIIIDNHEPAMPTGLCRTFPNLMTQEGVRGQEYDAWSADGGNPPQHTVIVPFTRGLAGSMDFTFGTFDFSNPAKPNTRVQTTIAKQLALYVVIYSPLQMASDLPENYLGKKEFDFIKIVPTNWFETRILDAKIGDFIVTARKDRNSEEWYLGAITDENTRELNINLDFLSKEIKYKAKIYKDGAKADWKTNPTDFEYIEKEVSANDILNIQLAKGGGQAIRFVPIP